MASARERAFFMPIGILTPTCDQRIVTLDMPRLTTLDYLNQRAALRKEWFENNGYAFIVLTPTQQFRLHDYYAFTKELAPLDALEHRKRVSVGKSSLPQQAGRAFTRIRPFLDLEIIPQAPRAKADRKRTWTAGKRRVAVFSQVKPELDPEQFARIIIEAAKKGPPPGWNND